MCCTGFKFDSTLILADSNTEMQNICVFEHVIKTLNAMDRIPMLRTSPVSVDGSKMKDMDRILREFLRPSVPVLSKSGDLMESYANLNIDIFSVTTFLSNSPDIVRLPSNKKHT